MKKVRDPQIASGSMDVGGFTMGMDIRLARIDDRLIHGQVATAWSKMTGINRIIVVSDEVANDQLRKFLFERSRSARNQIQCRHSGENA